MKNRLLFALCIILAFCIYSCQNLNRKDSRDSKLERRIHKYYSFLKKKEFERSFAFHKNMHPDLQSKSIAHIKKSAILVETFSIGSIEYNGDIAIAKMQITATERNNSFTVNILDKWEFVESEWMIVEAGRALPDDPDIVKPFDYDEYKKARSN